MKGLRRTSQRGFVVAIALIAIMVLTFFLLTGAATTMSTVKVSGNYSKTVDVFNIAEAGLAKARPLIEGQSFSNILATYTSTYLIQPTSFNGGTYEVTVQDDPNDGDVDPWTDRNGIIQVTSIGRNSQGGKVQIRTFLQLIEAEENPIEAPPNPSSCGGGGGGCSSAALMCGTTADIQGASGVDGDDHAIAGCSGCGNPPTDAQLDTASHCSGAGCNVSATTSGFLNVIGQGNVTCWKNATKTEACSGTYSNAGSQSNCSEWQTFYNQWASVSASAPGVVLLNGSSYTGPDVSCSDPKIFLINTASAVYTISGNHYLCGTFIIASNTSISMSGTVSLVGLFLMMGEYSNVTFTGGTGTVNMTGKLIFKSTTADGGKELVLNGSAGLVFSSAGVGYGMEAINNTEAGGGEGGEGSLITAAWEETY